MNKLSILLLLFMTACETPEATPEPSPLPVKGEAPKLTSNIDRGKQVYRQRCMSCHANPKVGTSLCPPNAGASLELLELKVLEGKYPLGYTPKKSSKIMPRFPFLKDDIQALHEYLNSI